MAVQDGFLERIKGSMSLGLNNGVVRLMLWSKGWATRSVFLSGAGEEIKFVERICPGVPSVTSASTSRQIPGTFRTLVMFPGFTVRRGAQLVCRASLAFVCPCAPD